MLVLNSLVAQESFVRVNREYTVRLCILEMSIAITTNSHQCNYLNMNLTRTTATSTLMCMGAEWS